MFLTMSVFMFSVFVFLHAFLINNNNNNNMQHPVTVFTHQIKESLLNESERKNLYVIFDRININAYTPITQFYTLWNDNSVTDDPNRYIYFLTDQENPIENIFYTYSTQTRKLEPFSIQAQTDDWSYRCVRFEASIYVCITPSPAVAGVSPMKWVKKPTNETTVMLDNMYLCLMNMEKRLTQLEEQVAQKLDAVWFAPGMPGYIEAKATATTTMNALLKNSSTHDEGLD